MMDSSKHTAHTPTPWTVGPGPAVKVGRYNVAPTITAGGSAKGMIDELDVAKANAAFIVRAVNSHDQLVEALNDAIVRLTSAYGLLKCDDEFIEREVSIARAAIAAAEA